MTHSDSDAADAKMLVGDGPREGATPTATIDYAAIRAVNISSLKYLEQSPLLYRYRMANPEPRKQAFLIGGAFHCAVLEPDLFDKRYAVFDGTRRGSAWEEWKAKYPGIGSRATCCAAGAAKRSRRGQTR